MPATWWCTCSSRTHGRCTRWNACGASNWTSRKPELRLLAIGRLKGPEALLFAEYAVRLRPPLAVSEFAEARGSPAEAARREGAILLGMLADREFVVALDAAGTMPDSTGLAGLLTRWRNSGRELVFLIGGPEGMDAAVLARANATLSLGALTWPHRLARIMLAEQLYRAQTIQNGHPYHRTRRPE